jgi:hypothetical protein
VNRKTKIITSVSAVIVISLVLGLPLYFHYSSIHYPPVTIISYELNPEAGENWILNVTTWVPNGCYQDREPTVDIGEKEDFIVFIIIKTKYQRRVVCDAAIHVTNHLFQISFPEAGNWTVHCNDQTITVYVQEA